MKLMSSILFITSTIMLFRFQVQGEGIDGSQPLVLAEVDGNSGEMVAVKGMCCLNDLFWTLLEDNLMNCFNLSVCLIFLIWGSTQRKGLIFSTRRHSVSVKKAVTRSLFHFATGP